MKKLYDKVNINQCLNMKNGFYTALIAMYKLINYITTFQKRSIHYLNSKGVKL